MSSDPRWRDLCPAIVPGSDKALNAPKLLFRGSDPGWAESDPWRAHVTGGPFLYRPRKGRLLMLWSTFSQGDRGSYVQALSYSENGEITGPWRHFPKPLFEKNGGYGMILVAKYGRLLLSLHRPNQPPLERPCLIPLREAEGTLVPLEPDCPPQFLLNAPAARS